MAKKKKEKEKEADAGTLGRLSQAGEEALTRLMDELGKNERVTEALAKAMSAKGKLDESARRTITQVGLGTADELRDLRKHVERLEKRVVKLEAEAKSTPKTAAKPRTTKPRASSPAQAKKTAEESASPAPGRALGGGTGRGAGSGGTAAS